MPTSGKAGFGLQGEVDVGTTLDIRGNHYGLMAGYADPGSDYYFNSMIGIGIGLTLQAGDRDDDDSTRFEIRASVCFNTKLGITLSHAATTYEDPNEADKNEFKLRVVGRF